MQQTNFNFNLAQSKNSVHVPMNTQIAEAHWEKGVRQICRRHPLPLQNNYCKCLKRKCLTLKMKDNVMKHNIRNGTIRWPI